MIMSPANIQTQLGEAISVIADSDFWKRWDTLIPVGTISNEKRLEHPETNMRCVW